jgi:hypothetical protein
MIEPTGLVMTSPDKPEKEIKFEPPDQNAYICKQIDLFQTFLCNRDEQREKLSNAIPLWDCLPLYSVSRQWAHKMRKEGNFPQLLIRDSLYKGSKIRIEIQPARILENGVVTEYYPGANEELIEAALRKIATIQNHGYYDESTPRYGVNFSIYQLRKELKNRGHARSYQEIVLSLRILARSSIEITANNNKTKIYDVSNYFSRLSSVSRFDIEEDPHARWYVEFHPLITKALKAIDYRQFNYELMMSHDTQLTRWLHKYLIAKFTYAGRGQKFEIRYSTIKRDSGLLESFGNHRKAMQYVRKALTELADKGILEPKLLSIDGQENLIPFEEAKILGERGQTEDVIYTLYPAGKFSSESKQANANLNRLLEK